MLKLTELFKAWLVENTDVEKDASDDDFRKAAGDAFASGKLSTDKYNELTADKGVLRSALQRTAILSNEKYRGIRVIIRDGGVVLQAHNPEQEKAEEEVEVEYSGDDIEIGFNVNYLLDAIAAAEGETVTLSVVDSNSSCLVRSPDDTDSKFVVMPMRL